jgi:hypothetical protein
LHRIHLHRLALVFPIVVFPPVPALGADSPAAALEEGGLAQYDEPGVDASAKSASQALEEEKPAGVKLGPSADFRNVVKSPESAEKQILGRATASTSRRETARSRR